MARYASEAERLRAHREAFNLALELGITPREAEAELRRRRAIAHDRESTARLQAKMCAASQPSRISASWDAPWMMRN